MSACPTCGKGRPMNADGYLYPHICPRINPAIIGGRVRHPDTCLCPEHPLGPVTVPAQELRTLLTAFTAGDTSRTEATDDAEAVLWGCLSRASRCAVPPLPHNDGPAALPSAKAD